MISPTKNCYAGRKLFSRKFSFSSDCVPLRRKRHSTDPTAPQITKVKKSIGRAMLSAIRSAAKRRRVSRSRRSQPRDFERRGLGLNLRQIVIHLHPEPRVGGAAKRFFKPYRHFRRNTIARRAITLWSCCREMPSALAASVTDTPSAARLSPTSSPGCGGFFMSMTPSRQM